MKNFYCHIKYLCSIYISGILFFALIRLFLMLAQWERALELPENISLILQSFWMGFRFDSVISGYILALPLVVLLLSSVFGIENKKLTKCCHIYLCVLYSITLFGCIANIPYFEEFFKHINASIFNWKDEKKFVFTMILKEKSYLMYFFLSLIFPVLWIRFTSMFYKKIYIHYTSYIQFPYPIKNLAYKIVVFIILGGICFLGIRGRIAQKSPIRVGTAFFSNYAFPNQLGLNPIFYFFNSVLEAKKKSHEEIHLMPDEEAINRVRLFYQISDTLKSPIARRVIPEGNSKQYNIVLILMESMSAELMQRNGAPKVLIPFLDSLSNHSLYFENYYSAGIHTMNGVFSSLFSYPALFNQHPMKTVEMLYFNGLPYVLKKNGYHTAYFTTHDDQFDNIGGFLKINGVELIRSQRDYPLDKIKSNLGVPDDYMFEKAISTLNQLSEEKKKPFFATMLTSSYHTPYIIPEYYKTPPGDIKEQIITYSDWSLQKFFEMAKKEKWFGETIFILTADHGSIHGIQPYEISLSRHHSPLVILGPGITNNIMTGVASQLDIFPTIMGLLKIPYINNSFGLDLLKEKRKYALLNSDDIVACIDDSLMYVYSTHGKEALYQYKIKSTENKMEQYPQQAKEMKEFMFSTMQSAQYLIKNDLTLDEE